MSDYRAVAAATLTLQNMLLDAIQEAMPGATVKTGPPESRPPEEVGEGLINIFLFRVEPNKVWRNEDLPTRLSDGSIVRKPVLAVDVHYLLSFYGDERRKIPYLLMGLAMTALHADPYPSVRYMPHGPTVAGDLEAGAVDPVSAALAGSGLERQAHPLSFVMLPLRHDELIPLFSQIHYVMSVAYRASVLLMEPYLTPQPSLPVRRADLFMTDGLRPVLAGVNPQLLPYSSGAILELRGEGLGSRTAKVLVGDLETIPTVESDGSLRAPLPDGIQAGTHFVRVVQAAEVAGGSPRWAIESNPVSVIVEPVVIDAVQIPSGQAPAQPAGTGSPARAPVGLRVRLAPMVTAHTPVVLVLNGARSYAFQAEADPRVPDTIMVQAEIEPGSYLVRVQINGVTSRLRAGAEGFDGPRAVIV
jgi:hypothetical protein